jgi:hypothetical protein
VKRIASLLLVCLLGGCALISVDNKIRYRDASGFFDPRLLAQIQPETTTGEWLRQHFGDPLFVDGDYINPMVAGESVEIDTWHFLRYRQKNTRVFLLFKSRKRVEESEYLHVVLANDRVVKAWRDTFETVDTRRVMRVLGYKPAPTEAAAPATSAAPVQETPALQTPSAAALEVKDIEESLESEVPQVSDHQSPAPEGAP